MKTTLTTLAAIFSASGALTLAEHKVVPIEAFQTMEGLEVTLWAQSPMFYNPANMDVDKDGRIWIAEGVNYRSHYNRKPEGDRIMVLEDTDGDGKADKEWPFVQEEFLRCPMGVAVIDNKVVVSMTPDMIVYTDVDRNLKFDPEIDKREVLLTGFNGRVHDHSLHSVTVGPDGQWYWNAGNCGAIFTDRSGRTFRIGSSYMTKEAAGLKSDDGHVYVGGFTARMNPDGSMVHVIGHNYRNSYEQTITSFGDVFQNDNDDPPAARTTFVMEYGNAGFSSFDGQRSWGADRRPGQSTQIAEWRQEDPGTMPSGDVYGGGAPTGIAYYENGALGDKYQGMLLSCEPARNTVFGYFPTNEGAGFKLERFNFLTTNSDENFDGADFTGGFRDRTKRDNILFRPSDVVVGPDGAIYVSDWYDARVGGHGDMDETLSDLGDQGIHLVKQQLEDEIEQVRVVSYRALRRQVRGFVELSELMAENSSPAVGRELALAMRDIPYKQSKKILLSLAKNFNGTDRYYLEALGTGATGKESKLYTDLFEIIGVKNSINWTKPFAEIAWRLHAPPAVEDFGRRAQADSLTLEERKSAVVALSYMNTELAVNTIIDLAEKSTGMLKAESLWWLLNRKDGIWKKYKVEAKLRERGIFNQEKNLIYSSILPEPLNEIEQDNSLLLNMSGNVNRGKLAATACITCHKIEGLGVDADPI